jgi:hypothetical protein
LTESFLFSRVITITATLQELSFDIAKLNASPDDTADTLGLEDRGYYSIEIPLFA